MEQEIRVQIGDNPWELRLSDNGLIDQIFSLVKTNIRDNRITEALGATENFAAVQDMPISRIIIGPAKGSCRCCGRPFEENK